MDKGRARNMDNTTKFQSKFDLHGIWKESGVSAMDTGYIVYAVQNHDDLIKWTDRVDRENEKLKELIKKSLVACTYCPLIGIVCGEACSIRELKEYIKLCGEGGE